MIAPSEDKDSVNWSAGLALDVLNIAFRIKGVDGLSEIFGGASVGTGASNIYKTSQKSTLVETNLLRVKAAPFVGIVGSLFPTTVSIADKWQTTRRDYALYQSILQTSWLWPHQSEMRVTPDHGKHVTVIQAVSREV